MIAAACFALSLSFTPASAQRINISIQPSWGPSGYDYAEYYYIPELNIYYDVSAALFYYLSGSNWKGVKELPRKYKKYDLNTMYKVVMNNTPNPWLKNSEHKTKYKSFSNVHTQKPISQATPSAKKPDASKPAATPKKDTKDAKKSNSAPKNDTKDAKKSSSSSKKNAPSGGKR